MRPAQRLVCTSVLALVLACGAPEPAAEGEAAQSELAPAPEFVLSDLAGGELSLSELRGRPVVLDFWATWCAPCVHQIPILNAFHARRGDEVAVIGISVDVRGEEVVAPFATEHAIDYRVLLGDEGLAQAYGALGFPTLYVISPEGEIDSVHVGVISEEALDEAVSEWVSPRRAEEG